MIFEGYELLSILLIFYLKLLTQHDKSYKYNTNTTYFFLSKKH